MNLSDNVVVTIEDNGNGKTCPPTGYDIAEKLNEMGYTKLILISGEPVNPENMPAYLTILLKTDNDILQTLDKI